MNTTIGQFRSTLLKVANRVKSETSRLGTDALFDICEEVDNGQLGKCTNLILAVINSNSFTVARNCRHEGGDGIRGFRAFAWKTLLVHGHEGPS